MDTGPVIEKISAASLIHKRNAAKCGLFYSKEFSFFANASWWTQFHYVTHFQNKYILVGSTRARLPHSRALLSKLEYLIDSVTIASCGT